MAGLGTIFIGLMGLANLQRWQRRLESSRALLWALMLAFPFPFIANTVGWMTAELGPPAMADLRPLTHVRRRQPRREPRQHDFHVDRIHGSLYFVLASLYVALVGREVYRGLKPR